ncbi:site-specific integrase [Oceanobacillus arenosus]|uniref:Site-specific integrase n=1 Tax=Oceanobacillus arenosus TaxID=1229153 RepID=A0A3D8Q081_9BACI|nr:site-specific integrase [Oceanobacillus arenosus]RDW21008.1 site-specific integrase [Oceanobacillus arenosus]
MASFTKRGKTWQYVVSAKPKPLRKGGFKTKKEAQVAAAEVEAELRKGVVPNLKPQPFDEYFENWLKLYKGDIGLNTMERYKNTLETVKDKLGGIPIQNINKQSYQAFLNEYGLSHAKDTTRKLNTHIRACVKDSIDEGLIRVDFTRGAVITGKPGKKAQDKYLEYAESKQLLKLTTERLDRTPTYYLLLLALTSGMRFAEMVGLTRKDFNFFNNTISITKTWGYTNKMHEGFGPTKNEQSIRVIKMDPKTMKKFSKLFDTTPDNIHRLVFYSPHSKYKVITNNVVNKVLKGMLDELKIDTITVHGLRHTHASVLLYEGATPYYVSERLGHGDIETTMNTYSHVLKELRQRDEEMTTNVFEKMYV